MADTNSICLTKPVAPLLTDWRKDVCAREKNWETYQSTSSEGAEIACYAAVNESEYSFSLDAWRWQCRFA